MIDDKRIHSLICEAEAVGNSCPTTPVLGGAPDLEVLAHTICCGWERGHGSLPLPLGEVQNEECYRRRWKHVQFLADQFWKRWLKEYLPLLRQRTSHLQTRRNFQKGDLVLVTDEATPRNQWKLGRIVYAKPGADGLVRQVKVRTAHKVYARPVNKLCFLEGLGSP